MVGRFFKISALLLCAGLGFAPSLSYAQCASPAGVAGEMGYNLTSGGEMEYCDGTSWVSMNNSLVSTSSGSSDGGPSPIGHWNLNETSGTSVADSEGSYTGTMQGTLDASTATAAGKMATAIHFDGTDGNYISIGSITDILGVEQLTVVGWFKRDSAGDYVHFWGGSASSSSMGIGFYSTTLWLGVNDGSGGNQHATMVGAPNDTNWHHLVMVFDGTQTGNANRLKLYVDNVQATLSFNTAVPATMHSDAGVDMRIGSYNGSESTGTIDDLRVYDRVLTETEISYLYTSTQDLVGYWKLDETSGTSATDSSGNGNTGAMTNLNAATDSVTGKVATALAFGGSDLITAGAAATNIDDIFSGGGSIAYWIYPTNWGTFGRVVDKSDSGTFPPNSGWHSQGGTGYLKFSHAFSTTHGDWTTAASTVPMNTWSYITITYDSSNTANDPVFYVNGLAVSHSEDSAPSGTAVSDAAQPITLGARQGGSNAYTGYMDDVRLYNRELSASEALVLYQQTQDYGLTIHWKLDETSGNAIADFSGNGNDGIWNESGADDVAGETITGKIDTALSFSSGKYIEDADFVLPSEGTFAAWVTSDFYESNEPAGAFPVLFYSDDPDTYMYYNTSGEYFTLSSNGTSTGRATYYPPADITGWFHLAATWSTSGSQIYLNGVAVGTPGVGDHSTGPATGGFAISTRLPAYDRYWNGDIDDARVYNKPLTASEIVQLYNEGKSPELVGHWKLDETSGSVIVDSAFGHDGVWTDGGDNDVVNDTAGGRVGTSLYFNGSNDVVNLGQPEHLNFNDAFTVSAWIYPEDYGSGVSTNPRVISRLATSDASWEMNIESGDSNRLRFRIANDSSTITDVLSGYSPPIREWTHVTGVFRPGVSVDIYINGELANSTATALTTHAVSSADIAIGQRIDCSNCKFNGRIDDVRIYNAALSTSQIHDVYACSRPGELFYNSSDHVIRWCDAALDVYNAGVAGAGGGGCAAAGSKAAGVEGTIQYDTANNKMVFCDGANWVNME